MTERPDHTEAPALDLSGLIEQTIETGLMGLPLEKQLSLFAERVVARGLPMKRVSVGMATLHPRYGALTYLWRPGASAAESTPQERSVLASEAFRNSPVNHMLESGAQTFRQRLDGSDELPFPVLEEIRREGMTDYAACIVRFNPDAMGDRSLEGVFFSCATDEPGGFDMAQVRDLVACLPYLAMAVKSRLTYDVADTVTSTYLGADAGRRVLTGAIERGSAQAIDAAIWVCDLRGFTRLADRLDRNDLIDLLNAYFDVLAEPVQAHGGQILKFLGDGFLATFDLSGSDRKAVCASALDAAAALRAGVAAFNQERGEAGLPTLEVGLALHVGEVLYGNVGTQDRLDFTVVGPAVNEASRIQDLCRPLGRDILVSRAFREMAGEGRHALSSVGTHTLRDVSAPQELFTLDGA